MKYERPTKRTDGPKKFTVGTHPAKINKITPKKTKKGGDMFIIFLEGNNEEQGLAFLVFGNDFTKENMNYILASIEDNGQEIPDMSFGFNKVTYDFLLGKEVYIEVIEKEYKGEMSPSVNKFLTLVEYEESSDLESDDVENEEWWK